MNAAEFIKRYTEQGYAASDEAVARLADASFREEIYRHLHSSVSPSDGVLLQELLIQEISARRKHSDDEFHENLYWCAFLLYQVGDVQDIELLWEAKNIDFDTACGFDVQFLVGAGVEATIQYLRERENSDAKAALDYMVAYNDASDLGSLDECYQWLRENSDARAALDYIVVCNNTGDFESLDRWYQWRKSYFDGLPYAPR